MDAKLTDSSRYVLDRRQWFAASLALATATAFPIKVTATPKPIFKDQSETGLFRVRSVMEVSGEIRLKSQTNSAPGKNGKSITAKTAPMKVSCTIDYDEQFATSDDLLGCQSYQYFHEADSNIQVDRHVTKTSLRENCREILRLGTKEGITTVCPNNPLFAAERDLVEGPINSMFLDQLLTDKEVQIADKWTVDNEVMCRILNMDKVHEGKVVMCLVDADNDKAQLEIEGTVSASVRQVPTTMKIEGKAQLDRKGGYISWIAVNIEETREIGEAEPGFKVIAQTKILRSKIDAMATGLTLESVASRIGNIEAASMLQFQSDLGYYRFIANRKWSTYRDNGEEATFRYVVGNRVLAQCNVTNMIDFDPGRQLRLEGFIEDAKTSIGSALTEVIEAAEKVTTAKHRMLRVVSRGTVQGVGIQWVHYHISNDNGRRVVLAFTLNEENIELFAEEDVQIADSMELINWPTKLDAATVESESKSTEGAPISKPVSTSAQDPKRVKEPSVSSRPKVAR